jgi:FtsH-binding integral membrane protein
MKSLGNYKPAVRRHWLIFAAGVIWLAVGIGLTAAACFWLYNSAWPLNLVLGAVSAVLGMTVYLFGFSRIVRKNLARIGDKPEMVCLFAFQGRRSYFLILAMMVMGYTIRHLPIPKSIDAVVYFTMGAALISGSSLYFREFACRKNPVFSSNPLPDAAKSSLFRSGDC